MNWEAIGATAEAIGALGVIVSLLYLAVQIRQNTASVKAGSYDSWLSQTASLSEILLSNETLGRVWARGLSKPKGLDPTDRERFDALTTRFFRAVEFAHSKVASGLMDADLFDVWWQDQRRFTSRPGAILWWQGNCQLYTPNFRAFVDRELNVSEH
jgi:hypothetical protein